MEEKELPVSSISQRRIQPWLSFLTTKGWTPTWPKSLSSTNGLSLRFHIMCLWHSLIRKGEAPDKVASHLPDGPGSSHVEDLSEKASPDEMINYKRGRCHDEVTWPHVNCKGMEVTLRSAAT